LNDKFAKIQFWETVDKLLVNFFKDTLYYGSYGKCNPEQDNENKHDRDS